MINSVGICILSWFDLVCVLYLCFWIAVIAWWCVCTCVRFGFCLCFDVIVVCSDLEWVDCGGYFRDWLFCLGLLCFALVLFVLSDGEYCGVGLPLVLVGLGVVGCLCGVSAHFTVWSCAFRLFALRAVCLCLIVAVFRYCLLVGVGVPSGVVCGMFGF